MGTSCLGCDLVPHSGKVEDNCGECDGDGSSCLEQPCTTNDCSGHGTTEDGNKSDGCVCDCEDSWYGPACSIPSPSSLACSMCHDHCNQHSDHEEDDDEEEVLACRSACSEKQCASCDVGHGRDRVGQGCIDLID